MGLRIQFVIPVLLIALGAVIGAIVDALVPGLVIGMALGLVAAVALGQSAVRRAHGIERLVSVWGVENLPGGSERDEIDRLHEVFDRFLDQQGRRSETERQELERQAQLLDRMSDGVLRVNQRGIVVYANVAAGTLFGARNPVGRSFIATVRNHELNDLLHLCLATGEEQQRSFDIYGSAKIGNAVIMRLSTQPAEALVVVRDVTELTRLQTLRRDFVANVSHELRTPLSTIKILTETLIDISERGSDSERFLQNIDNEVDGMTALVNDLMELVRLESDQGELEISEIDGRALIDEVKGSMLPIAKQRDVDLITRASGDNLMLDGDRRRLRQAIVNLVHNAILHSEADGQVHLEAKDAGAQVIFRVTDEGAGIAPEDLERVWERFYKADRSRAAPGSGLGLAIVKHIALAHQGQATVTSEPGDGAQFELQIPKKNAVDG